MHSRRELQSSPVCCSDILTAEDKGGLIVVHFMLPSIDRIELASAASVNLRKLLTLLNDRGVI
jgi:hypothetical protein